MTDEEALEVIKSAQIGDYITGIPDFEAGASTHFIPCVLIRLEEGWEDISMKGLRDLRFTDANIVLLNSEKYIWSLS